MLVDFNASEKNVTARSVLTPELVELLKFMFFEEIPFDSLLVSSSLSLDDRSRAMDNLFQSLQDVSFVADVECLPEGENRVI